MVGVPCWQLRAQFPAQEQVELPSQVRLQPASLPPPSAGVQMTLQMELPVQFDVAPGSSSSVQSALPLQDKVEPAPALRLHALPPAHETVESVPTDTSPPSALPHVLWPSQEKVQFVEHAPEQVFLLEQLMETLDGGISPPSPKTQVPPLSQVQLVSVHEHAPEQGMGLVAELQPMALTTTNDAAMRKAWSVRMVSSTHATGAGYEPRPHPSTVSRCTRS